MKNTFTIASAYEWSKESTPSNINNSEKAIKQIVAYTQKRFSERSHKNGVEYKITYKRLRASAGQTMLDSIIKRIEGSQIIIFDITNQNPNVFIELGIALYSCKLNKNSSIYLIKEKKDKSKSVLDGLPSDLQGFFISEYVVSNNQVTFKDNNSLRMSIVSDVLDYYSGLGLNTAINDEVNFEV
jgi:hypothetical protein